MIQLACVVPLCLQPLRPLLPPRPAPPAVAFPHRLCPVPQLPRLLQQLLLSVVVVVVVVGAPRARLRVSNRMWGGSCWVDAP